MRTLHIAVMILFLAAWAAAQAPPPPPLPPHPPHAGMGKWWKNSEVVKELQLTEPQIKQIEQTFLDYRLRLIDLRADVERAEARLQPLIEADRPDETQVSAQIDAVLGARAKLEKTNTLMMLAIRRVLSVEQWKKLQEIQHKREGHFGVRGHGPMGGRMGGTFPGHPEEDVVFERRIVPAPAPAPAPQPQAKPEMD